MESKKIDTLEAIREVYQPGENPNKLHKSRLSKLDKLAVVITDKIGTMGFFFLILSWTILWLAWNIYAPSSLRFDPFPAFVLWLFISNLIQIHLMPLIMVGQNIQSKHAEIRTENTYKTDKKSEKMIETILLHLENQQKLIDELNQKIEKLQKP
jgi:uncharacterized membrane protein